MMTPMAVVQVLQQALFTEAGFLHRLYDFHKRRSSCFF